MYEHCMYQPLTCTYSPKRGQLEGCSLIVTSGYFASNDLVEKIQRKKKNKFYVYLWESRIHGQTTCTLTYRANGLKETA